MLRIDNLDELLALDRALRDLRFRPDPLNDHDAPSSPVLANIHRRVVQARNELETDPEKRAKLEEFRNWNDNDFYRPSVERLIRECSIWSLLQPEKRIEWVRYILSPFDATDAQIADLVSYGNEHHGGSIF